MTLWLLCLLLASICSNAVLALALFELSTRKQPEEPLLLTPAMTRPLLNEDEKDELFVAISQGLGTFQDEPGSFEKRRRIFDNVEALLIELLRSRQ